MTEDDFEPARRELCPDDACIGLIGPDGRCKVCGTVGQSAVADPRHAGMRSPGVDRESGGEDGLDGDRELCPDDTCVGVLGPDGRCKVCGTRGTSSASSGARADNLAPAADAGAREAGADDADADDEDRELCPDGSCIGLIGPDGRCKVCGTARASSAS
jgi:hypothetical protein